MKKLYKQAIEAYEKGSPIMSDAQFDKLEASIRAKYPDWKLLNKTGTKLKKYKDVLDEYMPSLNKVYPEDFTRWAKKYDNNSTFVVTSKLDGSSVQAVYEDGKPVKLTTRGNGEVGGGISYLIPYTNLPQRIKHKGKLVLRLEAVMQKDTFAKKYSKEFDTARNLVAGVLNRKLNKANKALLKDIDFVVLGVYGKEPLEGLLLAKKLGFLTTAYKDVVKLKELKELLTNELDNKHNYIYDMDGLVIAEASTPLKYKENERPKYMVAYKDNNEIDNAQETLVKRVIWQASHSGRLTPKVEIEPVDVDGVVIKYATAHNAKWLKDRGIGKGAKVKIVRSGDVIPKIVEVVKPKFSDKDLPKVATVWKGVHLHEVEQSNEAAVRNVHRFLVVNGVENIATGIIEDIQIKPTIINFIKLAVVKEHRALQLLANLGKVRSRQVLLELQHLRELDLINFLVGSGCFSAGVAVKRLQSIQEFVSIEELVGDDANVSSKLAGIKGIGPALIREISEGLERARPLLKEARKYVTITETLPEAPKQGRFAGMTACWTGYRSKEEEAKWLMEGGVITSFSNKTTYLFYSPTGKQSSKVAKAGDRAKLFSEVY